MKKVIGLLFILAVIVSCFSACTMSGYPVKAGESRIPMGVYAYYLSTSGNSDEALKLCKDYESARVLMKEEGITLSATMRL